MTKTLLLLILTFFISHLCKADTIDYWHVYYNKAKLKEFNHFFDRETIVLKTDNIKNDDSIIVQYFRDTPCSDCVTTLTAEDGNHNSVTTNHGKGTKNPVAISLADLHKYKKENGNDFFEIYYHEENGITNNKLLFRIKLE